MPNIPNPQTLGKLQTLIVKNPTAFVAVVFFVVSFATYFINIRQNRNEAEYWRTLYEKERCEKDQLKNELLIKAGVIVRQKEVIKEVKEQNEPEVSKFIENEK